MRRSAATAAAAAMSGPRTDIPFLPGNTFQDVMKSDFRKPHSLGYVNGYPVQPKPILGIGLHQIETEKTPSVEQLLEAIGSDPRLEYGDKQFFSKEAEPRFVPAHVAFDKVVLRFDGYFKETVHESVEQFHLRKVRILYFLEDDSIAVVEPPVENSGIPHGVLIKRQRLPKSSTEFYTVRDLNVGINITFYGKTFRIVSCDKFTENYLTKTEGITLNPPEPMLHDQYQGQRARPVRVNNFGPERNDKLKRFLENDRKVLRYYCVWDDRDSMFGELREFVIHYHLVDDSIEVREVQKPNNGRDPFPILLRRQQLPKLFKELSDLQESDKYTWKDFRIGSVVNVLGRPFLIRDCDDYTKRFYSENADVPIDSLKAIPIDGDNHDSQEQEIPPYNGFGTVEDSLGSCKYLVLKPPKKDFIKMLENEHKVLRFVARMESKHKEDKDRRFVISYRLADDMMTIYEPPQRNAGILGGKFMERTRVLRPGSSLSDVQGPSYYDITDLYVGGKIDVLSHRFVLLDADEYVFNYMEADPARFRLSDVRAVMDKAQRVLKALSPASKQQLCSRLKAADSDQKRHIDRRAMIDIAKSVLGDALAEHEIVTVSRQFESAVRKVDYNKLIAIL
nr:EF-hand domain-containing protein 1 [Polyrhizophydium stewartii]